ncbi:alcohol dehydrogenase catalytic domain-containing protein, partial [Candidatus Woesearchaeota archaeon]|nr:alcohol dehydrogenase catalytic domain-containing protein [Candidatus Woesearchaeota archaeon]
VEEVGDKVTSLKKGDYAVATARRGCGQCQSCFNGQSDMCFTGLFSERGLHKLHGFFTDHVVDPEEYIVKVSPKLKNIAVLAEPMSIVVKGVEQAMFVQSRLPWTCDPTNANNKDFSCRTAVIIGAGPIGFLAACLLRLQHIDVYVLERKEEDNYRIKLLKGIGAKYMDIRKIKFDELSKITGNVDIMFEASGASELAVNMIPHMGRNGVYVMTGIPRGELHYTIDTNLMLRQIVRFNQAIIGTVNGNRNHFVNGLNEMEQIEKKFKGILSKSITARYRLDDYKKAIFDKNPDNVKVIFEIGK